MDVGVAVGRFQVENLHEGHRFLLGAILSNHRKVIVFIGVPNIQGTIENPLDYPTRRRMLAQEFPEVELLPLKDCPGNDKLWSENLDRAVRDIFPNVKTATLYGGRDSSIKSYKGKFNKVEVDSGLDYKSGSQQRAEIGKVVRGTPDFRAGVIHSTQNEFPYVKACVDIAFMKGGKILLGKKPRSSFYVFPGGMVDPGESYEEAALREMHEETGIIGQYDALDYVGSASVEDERFKGLKNISIGTALFKLEHPWEHPQANDDLESVRWATLEEAGELLMPAHQPLLIMLINHLNNKTKKLERKK